MSGGGARVPIPASEKKIIQNIMEIARNHSEEEAYAMFLDCSRDPDETVQRLLAQDPFHEVKRKRERRKENKEPAEPRWKPGSQGRGNRGGRTNFPVRYTPHDVDRARNTGSGRDNGGKQAVEKTVDSSQSPVEAKIEVPASEASTSTVLANGSASPSFAKKVDVPLQQNSMHPGTEKPLSASSSNDKMESQSKVFDSEGISTQQISSTPTSSSATVLSPSMPALAPSNGSLSQGFLVPVSDEILCDQMLREQQTTENRKSLNKFHAVGKNHQSETSHSSSYSSNTSTKSGSRPSSNYGSRSQQIIGPQKVGSTKEWKPKTTNPSTTLSSGKSGALEVNNSSEVANNQTQAAMDVLSTDEATERLQKKLQDLHVRQRQHVIIRNHIQIPESERTKLTFGSFDTAIGVRSHSGQGEDEKHSGLSSLAPEYSQEISVEAVSQNMQAAPDEGNIPDKSTSPSQVGGSLTEEGFAPTSTLQECNELKHESVTMSESHHNSTLSTNHSLAYISSSQPTNSEIAEAQTSDASRLPSFVVPQPFGPASYYAPFYRSGVDTDGRVSPFHLPGVASKFNEPVAVGPQTSQPSQEGANSFVVPTAGPSPLVTQPAGLIQSSISVTQQPVHVYRPPAGMTISPFQPSFFPYGHYYSPFYVSPPAMHQFLSNGGFPQQPQTNSVYPGPAVAAGVKFPLPQYKPGANAGNLTQMSMPSGYGLYGSSLAGYNPGSATSTANSTGNDDLNASQMKENNVFITGQQNEGSAVWMPGPGRDVSAMPATPFYNLPPQGQHMSFPPTQTVIYHPGQAVTGATVHPLLQQSQAMAGAVDMVTPAGGVYQQPQQPQINWPSNY